MGNKDVQKWADEAMYRAEPLTEEGEQVVPTVTLIEMTRRPLQVMASAAELYRGGVYRSADLITREQALEWLDGFKNNRITAPLEFIHLHFFFEGVTRAFTHQLVRQRTATFVQESMRFAVKENAAFEVAMPPTIAEVKEDDPKRVIWDTAATAIAISYNQLIAAGVPAEDARGLLPTNIATRIHYDTDLRNLVSQAGNRLCSQAQAEWKQVWAQMIHAILNFGPKEDRWQQKAIARLFRPICYQTGSCGFNGPADRYCVIRDRVNAHAAAGDPPDTWADINPQEPLHHASARRPRV